MQEEEKPEGCISERPNKRRLEGEVKTIISEVSQDKDLPPIYSLQRKAGRWKVWKQEL